MNYRSWLLTALVLIAALAGLVGPQMQEAQAQAGESRVRFLHAVAGAPNVDVYVDGALAAADLAYGEVTPHLTVAAGDHTVTLRQAGSGAESAALLEVPVPLAPDLAFTIVAQGAANALEAALYEDILDPLEPGMARLTAINAIPDAPPLDVITTAGGPLLQGVNYATQFGTINIPTGLQDLVVVPAGGAVESAIAPVGQVALRTGTLYTIVMLGTLEGTTEPSTMVLATPTNAAEGATLVRVAHGSADAPAVDVYANDTLIVPALELGQMTGHVALPAGDYAVALRPAGSALADEPVLTANVTLDGQTPALTLAAVGQLADETLALQVFPDNLAGMTSELARLSVLNSVPGSTATVSLATEPLQEVAAGLESGQSGAVIDIEPGAYLLTAEVAGDGEPVQLVIPEIDYIGGTYYNVLVYGGGANAVPVDASVEGTAVMVTVDSLPGMPVVPPAIEATEAPADRPAPTEPPAPTEAPVEATPESAVLTTPDATVETEVVPDDAPPPTAVAQEPTAVPATPAPLQTQPTGPTAFVELDPNANLHCRQYPRADALSLGLIPSGATVAVLGRTGEPLVPDTGDPTPEPTPVVETIEDLWVSVRWDTPDGGFLRCWVAARYLRVEDRGRVLDDLEELLQLPEVPFNEPGEAVNTGVSSPTPIYDAVLATVELDPGVSLQLRRYPQTDAEALDRIPAQAQAEVLGYAEVPSEGLVGQPVDPNWLRVRYLKEDGGAVIGWISAQYVSISQLGRPVEITSLPQVDPEEAGFYEQTGQPLPVPVEQQEIVGVVALNPGANLNLRDRPTQDARVVVGIPSGETVILNGRNADATWVRVTYESAAGTLEGWVAAQYLSISRGGQSVDLMATLPDLTEAPEATPAPVVEGQPTATPQP